MNKTTLALLLVFLCIELNAQSINKKSNTSLELTIGMSDVNLKTDDYIFFDWYCFDCDYEEMTNDGHEFNSRLTINKVFNRKHELILGLGLNLWRYDVDKKSGWTGRVIDSKIKNLGFVALMTGYRYSVIAFGKTSIFVEAAMYAELNNSEEFKNFKFSVSPAIGMKFKVNERLNLLTSINYKRSLSNITAEIGRELKQYSLGINLGASRSFSHDAK